MPERALSQPIEREVSATLDEFRHGLRLAFPGGVSEQKDVIRVRHGLAAMEIVLETLPPRIIALLTLPRLKVTLRGTAGSATEQAAMLAHMDRAMQRGGG